ncbi:hypothetical protein EDD22DRAFT_844815 [Suillus occidentalis]|nr:hypothetical protein EDD22DRAFT_844815 [Suillus occidentalis]
MATTGISLDSACLLAVALEGIVYGFSILLFIGTIWSLAAKQRIQSVNCPIATVAILLFVWSTAHMIVNIIRVEVALVKYRDTHPGGPAAFFADPSQKTLLILHGLYVLQTMLVDGAVCTDIHKPQAPLQTSIGEITQWVTAFFASTMATNVLSSVRMLMDAAVLYTVVLFIGLICFVISNNRVEPVVDMIMPIISNTFYMVLIRIAINRQTHRSEQFAALSNAVIKDPWTFGRLAIKITQLETGASSSDAAPLCSAELPILRVPIKKIDELN